MESMVYALYLLEQIKLTGLDFIFKGGTSLVLLLEQPKRFSIDIDIIVSPSVKREKLEKYLSKIVEASAFLRMEFDESISAFELFPSPGCALPDLCEPALPMAFQGAWLIV